MVQKLDQIDLKSLTERDSFLEIEFSILKERVQLKKSYTLVPTENKSSPILRGQIVKEQVVGKEGKLDIHKRILSTISTIQFNEIKFKETPFIQYSLICSQENFHSRIVKATPEYFDVKFWLTEYNSNTGGEIMFGMKGGTGGGMGGGRGGGMGGGMLGSKGQHSSVDPIPEFTFQYEVKSNDGDKLNN